MPALHPGTEDEDDDEDERKGKGLKRKEDKADIEVVQTALTLGVCVTLVMGAASVVFLLGFITGRKFPEFSNEGEALVASAIAKRFTRPHVLLNNVTIKTGDGTCQIDHILVADTGIFVIETKHFAGWIYGNPRDNHWTQVLYTRKSKFLNPLRQNYGHVKSLQSLFKLPEDNFIPIVVFTGSAEFKTDVGPEVLKLADLIGVLCSQRPVVFDEKKMAYIVGRIEMKRLRRSIETDEYHLSYVQRLIQEQAVVRA